MKGYIKIEAIETPEEIMQPGMTDHGVAIDMVITECSRTDAISTVLSLCQAFKFTRKDLAILVLLFENPGGGLINSTTISIPKPRREGQA